MNWGKRTAGLLLVAGIGVLSPAGSLPVWAQSATPAPSQGGGSWQPPPSAGGRPDDTGKPPKNYELTTGCVEADKNLGATVQLNNKPWGQQYLQIEELHKIVRAKTGGGAGKDIKVGVIDTGVRQHKFFQNRVISGGEYVKDVAPGKGLEDCDGHGTEVAGIIAADPKNPQIGFIGVAPDATIVSIRQSSQNYQYKEKTSSPPPSSEAPPGEPKPSNSEKSAEPGDGDTEGQSAHGGTAPNQNTPGRQQEESSGAGTVESLAMAVVHAVDAGVSVMNLSVDNCRSASVGMTDNERKLQAAVKYAVEHNVVVVAAAGNTSDTCKQNDQPNPSKPTTIVSPPWFADDVISVAAIDESGGVAQFSITGPWVTVAAPGTKIISLDPAKNSEGLANLTIEAGKPSEIQGTSFAAPYVTGVVALVRAMYPDLKAREVMQRIIGTAQHPAAPGGRDDFVGYGVINPMAALTATLPSELGIKPAAPVRFPAELPPSTDPNWKPMVVALAGTGGGLVALLITLFVVHTVRRSRADKA